MQIAITKKYFAIFTLKYKLPPFNYWKAGNQYVRFKVPGTLCIPQ